MTSLIIQSVYIIYKHGYAKADTPVFVELNNSGLKKDGQVVLIYTKESGKGLYLKNGSWHQRDLERIALTADRALLLSQLERETAYLNSEGCNVCLKCVD